MTDSQRFSLGSSKAATCLSCRMTVGIFVPTYSAGAA